MQRKTNATMTNDEFLSKYVFKELTKDVLAECEHFSCGVSDLDEYFQKFERLQNLDKTHY